MEWVCSLAIFVPTVAAESLAFTDYTPTELPKSVVEMIPEFVGRRIIPDPPQRISNLSIQKTSDPWESLTVKARLKLTNTDRDETNDKTGSSFKPPITLQKKGPHIYEV